MGRARTIRSAPALAGILLVMTLSGCGAGLGGGNTTCGDYLQLSASDQKQVIRNFFEEKGNSDPSGGEVLLSQQSAKLYCNTVGSESDPISNIDG